jgi:hypothetical protein
VTNVRKFMPENRLAKVLEDPNGLLFGHALKKAAANLETVRDSHMAALDEKISALGKFPAPGGAGDAAEVYRLAREIRADAAIFGLKDITRASHSLCELMASNRPAPQVWDGVAVHVHAILALRQPARGAAQARISLLEGLERISRGPCAKT